jgi:hypothetical protein
MINHCVPKNSNNGNYFTKSTVRSVERIIFMEALTLIPFSLDNLGEEVKPKPWRERLLDVVRRIIEFFQDVADTPIDGTLWPVVISLLFLAALVFGASILGWRHAAAGP